MVNAVWEPMAQVLTKSGTVIRGLPQTRDVNIELCRVSRKKLTRKEMKKGNFLQNNVFSRVSWDIAVNGKRPVYYTERETDRQTSGISHTRPRVGTEPQHFGVWGGAPIN